MTMQVLLNVVPVVVLIIIGFTVGSYRERRHYRQLAEREAKNQDVGVVNLREVISPETVGGATLVMGQAVIASDYFKSFIASLKKLVGGELQTYERLMERARREALLRAIDRAREVGATELWNIRYETSNIMSGRGNQFAISVEVFAYGTAITRKSETHAAA